MARWVSWRERTALLALHAALKKHSFAAILLFSSFQKSLRFLLKQMEQEKTMSNYEVIINPCPHSASHLYARCCPLLGHRHGCFGEGSIALSKVAVRRLSARACPLARRRIQGAGRGRGRVRSGCGGHATGRRRSHPHLGTARRGIYGFACLSRQLIKTSRRRTRRCLPGSKRTAITSSATNRELYLQSSGTVARTMKPASPRSSSPSRKTPDTDQALCPPPAGWEAFLRPGRRSRGRLSRPG